MSDGERQLAASVVLQALEDLHAAEPARPREQTAKAIREWRGRVSAWRREKDEAERFLTADSGEWAKSRERWCALAGIDADAVREKASVLAHVAA